MVDDVWRERVVGGALGAVRAGAPALRLGAPVVRGVLRELLPPVAVNEDRLPGLFGPESVTWRVHGHPSVFLGAVRALMVQVMHPEVAAGVVDHSRFQSDTFARLQRTASWVAKVTYGSVGEAHGAVGALRGFHRHVRGVSHRGVAYDASDPALMAWVHNSLVDSFLVAYRMFGPGLSDAEADGYVREQRVVGEMLGCDGLPGGARELAGWLDGHPAVGPSPGLGVVLGFLAVPPLPMVWQPAYRVVFRGAAASLYPTLGLLGPRVRVGDVALARVAVGALGEVLGGERQHPGR